MTTMRALVLLSGPMAVGKSTVATELIGSHSFRTLRSSPFLNALIRSRGEEPSRASMQQLGDALDASTNFSWVVDDVATPMINASPEVGRWLFDAVRKHQQVSRFRQRFGDAILHVHLTAPDEELRRRFSSRIVGAPQIDYLSDFDRSIRHPNEVASRSLESIADLVLQVHQLTAGQIATSIMTKLTGDGSNA
jgi:hypothetical protein